MQAARRNTKRLSHEPEAVKYALEKSGLTQRQVAAECGVTESLISEIVKGSRSATPDMLKKLAYVLNCPVVVLERKREPLAEGQPPAETGTPGDLPELRSGERTDQPGTDTAEVPELRNSAVGGS